MSKLVCLATAFVAALLAGCGSSEPTRECLPVDQSLIDRLELPAMQKGVQIDILEAKAVKGVENYFVAARFTAPGAGAQTGVWGTASIEGAGAMLYTTEGYSENFTRFPKAEGVNAANEHVKSAKACLE